MFHRPRRSSALMAVMLGSCLGAAGPSAPAHAGATGAVSCPQRDRLITDRTTSCFWTDIQIRIFRRVNDEQTGYARFSLVSNAALNPRSRQWTQRLTVTMLTAEGTATSGFTVQASATAPDDDAFTIGTSPARQLRRIGAPVTLDYQISAVQDDLARSRVQPVVVLLPVTPTTGDVPRYAMTAGAPVVRCDNASTVGPDTGGCVYPDFVPTYRVSGNNAIAQVAAHIRWAQQNLPHHWGWKGHGPALTRITDVAKAGATYRAACGNRRPTAGQYCHMYPFPDTAEAASPDYSWRNLDKVQANREMADLRFPWYEKNRVMDGDEYWVDAG
ncbi:hypothetical protein [Actinoplanes teichomyceticus]|uniref:Uncharacterized protein n=1 Tax=Actinoplanes teichomyceticus TaxID=1867 RepID=A0A561WJW0_ACTTI|nr:hypothetical protein [Actinoplanes teichomyceticus]TWG24145.1 hypothetical protein FHX34_102698 [Actinoplanes teichomyceticus]GIF13010.1 hypothetical protein Ate01nite_30420 [Actinoplanes teichomyceticus]